MLTSAITTVRFFIIFYCITGMPEPSSFETSLEADIRQLAAEIKNQRERPELKNAEEAEIVREAIRAFPEARPRPAAPPPAPAASSTSPLPAYAQDAPAEVKLEIEYLLDVAFREGLGKAF